MSQTQTATDVNYFPTSVREVLQVYEIHQTGDATSSASETSGWSEDAPWPEQPHRHYQGWVSEYNRVPPYREPARSHPLSSRPAGRDNGEATFVTMMFSGVYVVSVSRGALLIRVGVFERWCAWAF
jgi:hypothetical protein